jgi:histone H3/H4
MAPRSLHAANALRECIGEYGAKIAAKAVKYAQEDGRKTVLERDIWKAAEEVWMPESREAE